MQTYGCSMVLVRNQSALARSFAAHPEYLKDSETTEGGVEFWDLGPELTRPARCLKLWLTLQALGSEAMGEAIDHGCAMAELAEREIAKLPDWEIVSPARLGIVNFRCAPAGVPEAELDALNQGISKELSSEGFAPRLLVRGLSRERPCFGAGPPGGEIRRHASSAIPV